MGAAVLAPTFALDYSEAFLPRNVAAPGDGRTPAESPVSKHDCEKDGHRVAGCAGDDNNAERAQGRSQATELAREVRDKGWIIYGARTAKGDWDLFTMRPDGSDVRNLTNTPQFNEGLPRFSPDGNRILYRRIPVGERFDNNRHGLQGELVFANNDGSAVEVFGKEGEFPWASWSSDGKKIVCLSPVELNFMTSPPGRSQPIWIAMASFSKSLCPRTASGSAAWLIPLERAGQSSAWKSALGLSTR